MDRFFYTINDNQQNILVLKAYQFEEEALSISGVKTEFQNIFLEDKLLQLSYASTKIAFVNSKFTIVPNRLYDANNINSFLEHLIDLEEEDTTLINPIAFCDSQLLYRINTPFLKLIKNYYPQAKIYHFWKPLLLGYANQTEHQYSNQLFINVVDKSVAISLFKGTALQFCNIYHYKSANDFIYYVMLVFDQFNLKPETTPTNLSGMIVENSEIYHALYRYVRHLNLIKLPNYVRMSKAFKDIPPHFFFDLYSLRLCE